MNEGAVVSLRTSKVATLSSMLCRRPHFWKFSPKTQTSLVATRWSKRRRMGSDKVTVNQNPA